MTTRHISKYQFFTIKILSVLLKVSLLVSFVFFVIPAANAQKTWDRGANSDNWNDGNNWNPNGVPAAGENVIIGNGYNVVLNTNANNIASLTVQGTLNGSNNNTVRNLPIAGDLTISGSFDLAAANLTVGGTTSISGSVTDSRNNGSSAFSGLVTISGTGTVNLASTSTLTFSGGIDNDNVFSQSGTGTVSFNVNQSIGGSSNITFAGAVTIASNITVTNNSSVTLTGVLNGGNGNSTWLNSNNSTLIYGNGTQPMATGLLTATASDNTVNYNSANAQAIKSTTYYNLLLSGGNTKTGTGNHTVSGNLTINNGVTLSLGTAAATWNVTGNATVDGTLDFSNTNAKIFNLSGNLLDNSGTITMSGGNLAHSLNLGGTANAISTLNTGTGSTVHYNRSGAQEVFVPSTSYRNLTISGGGIKSPAGSITIAGVLTLNSGILQLGAYNATLSNTAANAVQGTPGNNSFVETNGNGVFIRPDNATAPIAFPVGSGGFYAPLSISAINTTGGNLSVKTIPLAQLGPKSLNRYWDVTSSGGNRTITGAFSYDPSEAPLAPVNIWMKPGAGPWQAPSGTQSFGVTSFTTTGGTIGATTSSWTASAVGTYYSYQTGSWNDPSTWTSDPGGTTQVGTTVPGDNDYVVILTGRTVSLPADIATSGLNITINEGGFLDQGTFRFTSSLAELSGQGTLQLSSANFPTVTVNSFINAGGGTTEYKNTSNLTLSAAQGTYNNLTINLSNGITATQLSDITLNGNLLVKQGTFRINDNASATRLIFTVNGDVTVNSGAFISVGNGSTNTTVTPTGITGGTLPFLSYYEQFHRVVIYGNFTNNGSVRFTNLAYPVYNAFPPLGSGATSGAASVYFRGNSSTNLVCNGVTDFYNLILDKGTDQTYSLTIQPSAYNNFRLFGANISGGDITNPATAASNPNLKKALWIRTGTLILKGLTVIPSLTEGETTGNPASDFIIPINGALVLDGSDVIVLATADNYGEVNIAYGVAGGTGSVNGVNTNGSVNFQGMLVLGRLQVNDGYLSTRESAGLLYNNVAAGQIEINNGIVDSKQFRENGTTGSGASYVQSGGLFILRGRLVRPVAFGSIDDLTSVSGALGTRAANGTNGTYGTFNINNSSNVFSMSGGIVRIYDACTTGSVNAVNILSSTANTNITDGTFDMNPISGSGLADATSHLIYSVSAPFGNLSVSQGSGCATTVQLNTYGLTVLEDLNINSGSLLANNLDISVGGDFTVANGATYNSGSNSTIFNGNSKQTFTINGTLNNGAPGLNNFTQDNLNDSLIIAGSQASLYVQGSLTLNGGTFDDGGKTVYVAGNLYNAGLHISQPGTGAIRLNGTGLQEIGGNGNGVFNNLTLDNNNVSAAPVSLTAATTVNGTLTFLQNKLFNISTYNLRLNANAIIVSGDATSYIQTSGNAGDGGLTKLYSSSSSTFTFPVGAPTLNPARAVKFTPATLTVNGTATAYGSITVIPVGYEHPATVVNGVSLTYFWRVKSQGFTLGPATITHGYVYDVADMAGITESECIAARYNAPAFSWTTGTLNDVDETNNIIGEPGTGSFLQEVTFIDGDYTAGDNTPSNPFGLPTVYYSRANNRWNLNTTWSTVGHTGPAAAGFPGINDVVIIGNNNTVNLTANASCASLQIESGSTLDAYTYTGGTFGMVLNHANGNGLFRVTTTASPSNTIPKFFTFPAGDFTDFNVNGGTTEFYDIDGTTGALYILPANVGQYGNLILRARGGDNLVLPNRSSLDIYGDLTCTGNATTAWIAMSWNTNIWPYFTNDYNPTIEKTVHVRGNLYVNAGSFEFFNDQAPQHLIVDNDIVVVPGAVLEIYGDYPFATPVVRNTIQIGASLINNGTVGLYRLIGGRVYACDLTFTGSANAQITNTSGTPTTVFNNVTVDKGNSQSSLLTLDIGGTLTTLNDNWLTLKNGTLRYMRNNPATDFTISKNTPFIIPPTSGLYIDYSNTNNRNVLLSNCDVTPTDANDVYLNGKLTLIRGNVYVGPTSGAVARNNDIEYSGGGASEIEIQGGNLVVNGQIRRNPAISHGILTYNQSGGAVTINGQNATTANAKFEILNNESSFQMSGGTMTIVRGGGGAAFGDVFIRPGSSTVTGGTIQFVNNLSGLAQSYRLDANVPLYNLTITGRTAATTANAQVNLMVNPLVLNGSLTLSNAFSILNTNNIDVTIKGDLINNGTPASYVFGNNLTTFNGNTQSIAGSSITNFYDLAVSPLTSLTLTHDVTVNHDLELGYGTMICGNFAVNLLNNFINNATYTDTQFGVILRGTTGQQLISGTGTFGRLELNNSDGARIQNAITLNRDLVLTNGIFNINRYMLTLAQNSNIGGSGFSASKMIETDGVFSDVGITKVFGPGAANFTFPIGVTGKYTPAVLTLTANGSVGSIRVNNINSQHPGVVDPDNVLQYFWEMESSGITGLAGSMVFHYKVSDVKGGPESSYVEARLIIPGTSWQKGAPGADQVDELNHTITFNFPGGTSNLNGEYTAGNDPAIPDEVPVFTSNSDGNWNDPAIWTQTAGDPFTLTGGPNGFIVIVNHEVTANTSYCQAYRTTIDGKLRLITPYFGHNFGTVNGSGTLYFESGLMPAGRFTDFLDCAGNSTLEYGGIGSYTINADLFDEIPNMLLSGSGTRILPNKDLTICRVLNINGPALDNSTYNKKLTILGNMTRTLGSFNAGTGAGATVTFAGTAAQTLGNFSGTNGFNNLQISNASGLTLNGPVSISANLLLTDGIITTTSVNSLTLTNTSVDCVVPAGGSSSSYVSGPLTKTLNQGDTYFKFPVGNATRAGNLISIRATQTGTLDWTVEYINPSSLTSVTAPLTAVNEEEYWNISTPTGGRTYVNIEWNPASDLTPLMTQNGISDMRISEHDGSNWIELTSVASGDAYNGSAETSSRVTLAAGVSKKYTLACINTPKPRIRLSPTGPVCGTAGIPVTLSSAYPIFTPYSIEYTIDGIAQTPISPAAFPAVIPTLSSGGVYQLTGFTYNRPAGTLRTGVVDITTVTTFAVPTTADAGDDQSLCGATSATLDGNTPVTGSGLWSIVSGSGGTVAVPANPTSTFNGTNGTTYVLRWSITNGSCVSSDNVTISFPLLAAQPQNFTSSSSNVCQGMNNVAYIVPNDPSVTYAWSYTGSGHTINGTGNSVTVDFNSSATSGTLSVIASNTCGSSAPRSIGITVNPIPSITLDPDMATVCRGLITSNLIYTGTTNSPNQYSIVYSASALAQGFANVTNAALGSSPVGISVPAGALANDYSANLTVRNSFTGCVSIDNPFTVRIHPLPTPGLVGNDTTCAGETESYQTDAGMSNYTWTITAGSGNIVPPGNTENIMVDWGSVAGQYQDRTVTITYTDSNGCNPSVPTQITVRIFRIPETGPSYYVPNSFNQ